jgi:hypothetical protein
LQWSNIKGAPKQKNHVPKLWVRKNDSSAIFFDW